MPFSDEIYLSLVPTIHGLRGCEETRYELPWYLHMLAAKLRNLAILFSCSHTQWVAVLKGEGGVVTFGAAKRCTVYGSTHHAGF